MRIALAALTLTVATLAAWPASSRSLSTPQDAASPLDELQALATTLANARDTGDFLSRPNIPYVYAHFTAAKLAAGRFDTALIIDRHGQPLLWRNLRPGRNRGFPDAKRFLSRLPALTAPTAGGAASFAGAVPLARGPTLVVAMPIHAVPGGSGARGWLILGRTLNAEQWRSYQQRLAARQPVAARAPAVTAAAAPAARAAASLPAAAQAKPLRSLPAIQGAQWYGLAFLVAGLGVSATLVRRRRLRVTRLRTAVAVNPAAAPAPAPHAPTAADSPEAAGMLAARIASMGLMLRYQPQMDLRTGRVAGVEALLCKPGMRADQAEQPFAIDNEAVGLGMALLQFQLEEALSAQRTWLRKVGHEFPVGVSVSQRMLTHPDLMPLLRRLLLQSTLAPEYLEIQVPEATLGGKAASMRALREIHDAGIALSIDGFDGAKSNLHLLSSAPADKWRINSALIRRIAMDATDARLFDLIIAAGQALQVTVCATGVASPELLVGVLRHGRLLVQGTAVGPPVDDETFLAFLCGTNMDTTLLRTLSENATPPGGHSGGEPGTST